MGRKGEDLRIMKFELFFRPEDRYQPGVRNGAEKKAQLQRPDKTILLYAPYIPRKNKAL